MQILENKRQYYQSEAGLINIDPYSTNPNQGGKPPDPPYDTFTHLTLTQGASPPDPLYGTFTHLTLTLTQGASPPDPPYGTLTYLTLTLTLDLYLTNISSTRTLLTNPNPDPNPFIVKFKKKT